ncbi:MAG: DMT family transporter, partial [bacterium]|nr:DMT family transporter [bacterium]
MWFTLALLGAFFQATYLILNKVFLRKINEYILGAGVFLTSSLFLFIFSTIKGFPFLGEKFFFAILITGSINVVTTILILKSLKTTDASLVFPMLSFTPAFTILTSFIILKEFPTQYGFIGVLLIVFGSYVLNSESIKLKKILEPFRTMFSTRGLIYAFIVAFLFSVSTIYDKIAVMNSDPIFGSAASCLFISILLILINFIRKDNFFKEYKSELPKFGVSGLANAFSIFLVNSALTMQIVPYVSSIKRVSVLFGAIYGFILFKEKNIIKRLVGTLIMVSGVAL